MLKFLKLAYTRCKDLFQDECHYYVYVDKNDEVEIIVKRPGLNRPALTWKHSQFIFSGSMQELTDYLEKLKPANKVVPIRG